MSEEMANNECQCDEALMHLCEYLDSEMSERDLIRLRIHLEECPPCADALLRERSLRVVLRRSCVEIAPDSLRTRVMTQITVLRTQSPPR